MACPICQGDAIEHLTFGGGLRLDCRRCGGFFRISSSLEALMDGRRVNTQVAQEMLAQRRDMLQRQGVDPSRPQDLEPTLYGDDAPAVLIYD